MKKISGLLALPLLLSALYSCAPDNTAGKNSFKLYYSGVSDIAPSTDFSLAPSYYGAKPGDFRITGVDFGGEKIETECFSVDSESGVFSATNTGTLGLGLYKISISCVSGGTLCSFKDIISVNLMRPVPESISAEPALVQVDLGDILDGKTDLPVSRIVAKEGAVTIKNYSVANVYLEGVLANKYKDSFTISPEGVVSAVTGNMDCVPGKYTLDIKLITYIVGEASEEGIYKNAVTFDITSKPLALTYSPDKDEVEKGYENKSKTPVLTGSLDDAVFEILSRTNPGFPVSIDASTGVITSDARGMEVGDECSVSVKVTNKYGSAEFADVYNIKVIDFIEPIQNFSYPAATEAVKGVAFSVAPAEIDGGKVEFSFVDLPETLKELSLNSVTGVISADKGNKIAIGEYTVKVKAGNIKGSIEADFKLNVIANPNSFTYVHWGNNLGLTPAKDYASQYRVESASGTFPVVESDIPAGRTVKFSNVSASTKTTAAVDASSGEITLSGLNGGNACFVVIKVTVSNGTEDDPAAVSKCFPVFFQKLTAVDGVTVDYKPFAFRVNPKTGGTSAVPVITGTDLSNFSMDYRRNFNWYNVNGPASHGNGTPSDEGSLIRALWTAYYASVSKSANYGSKDPVSYYSNASGLTNALMYAAADHSVVVNPEKWKDAAGNYADGVFQGQMTFVYNSTGDGINNGKQVFPIAVWFDTDLIK